VVATYAAWIRETLGELFVSVKGSSFWAEGAVLKVRHDGTFLDPWRWKWELNLVERVSHGILLNHMRASNVEVWRNSV
jgi:hypothetical protein